MTRSIIVERWTAVAEVAVLQDDQPDPTPEQLTAIARSWADESGPPRVRVLDRLTFGAPE